MKLFFPIFCALAFLNGVCSSCANSGESTATSAGQQAPKDPEQASVEIRKTADGQIAAIVKNHRELQNTYFVLSSLEPADLPGPISMTNVDVTFSNECVVFQSKVDKSVVILRLPSSTCPIQSTDKSVIFEGYGLARQQDAGRYGLLLNAPGMTFPSTSDILTCNCVDERITDDASCKAGGVGATECSYSSADTEGNSAMSSANALKCSKGYYACCR